MSTNTDILKRPSQQYSLFFNLLTNRSWQIMNVDEDGVDGSPPSPNPESDWPLIEHFDGVSSFGTISGSVAAGGWSCELTIPYFPTNFDRFFGVDIWIQSFHGGVSGVPGAAGVDPDGVRIFKGYQQTLSSNRRYGSSESRFPIESSTGFLRRTSFARGFDFAPDTPHGPPGSAHQVVAHLLLEHTNWASRSGYGFYFPDHLLDTFTVNDGPLWDVLTGLCGNFGILPWCFARREDDLFLGTHPNLDIDGLLPNVNSPIIDLDDELVLEWRVERAREYQCASVSVVCQLSDQTERVVIAGEVSGGEGSHEKYQIRTDDIGRAEALASALYRHLNRRWTVTAKLPLVVAIDLGDCVTVTTTDSQRNYSFTQKKFVAISVSYTPEFQGGRRTFTSEVVLDEIVI